MNRKTVGIAALSLLLAGAASVVLGQDRWGRNRVAPPGDRYQLVEHKRAMTVVFDRYTGQVHEIEDEKQVRVVDPVRGEISRRSVRHFPAIKVDLSSAAATAETITRAIEAGDRVAFFETIAPDLRNELELKGVDKWRYLAEDVRRAAPDKLLEGIKQGPDGKWRLGMNRARKSYQRAAIGALKTIGTAQSLFREGDKDRDNILDYANSLKELGDANLIDQVLASGTKQGYVFKVRHAPKTSEFLWMATAGPAGGKGRHFVTNHEGVVFQGEEPFAITDDCRIPEGSKPARR